MRLSSLGLLILALVFIVAVVYAIYVFTGAIGLVDVSAKELCNRSIPFIDNLCDSYWRLRDGALLIFRFIVLFIMLIFFPLLLVLRIECVIHGH